MKILVSVSLLSVLTLTGPLCAQPSGSFPNRPVSFEFNTGQADASVQFLSRHAEHSVFLTGNEAVVADANTRHVVRIRLVDANQHPSATGLDQLAGQIHYLRGNDPRLWQLAVPTFAQVKYENVYAGVDLVYFGHQRQLETDFLVAPGADPQVIELKLDIPGDDASLAGLFIDVTGDLVACLDNGEFRLRKPVAYQEHATGRVAVPVCYALKDTRRVGFELGDYDPGQPLVIDPVLVFSTYLGGTNDLFDEVGLGIAVDPATNVYLTGFTRSPSFPLTNAVQNVFRSPTDAFITKLDATGTNLVFSTYLGGGDTEIAHAITVDPTGNAYIVGETSSTNFPVTPNAPQTNLLGVVDAFVTKLGPSGTNLVFSTYLGGGGGEVAFAVALDAGTNVYVTGFTDSTNFPTVGALQSQLKGPTDAFVTKIASAGTNLAYSTYLGGDGSETGFGIATDASSNTFVTGETRSGNFPTRNAFQPDLDDDRPFGANHDAFVTKLDPTGTNLVYSTYLGGEGVDIGNAIAVDTSGCAYVTGHTTSEKFHRVNALQRTLNRNDNRDPIGDAFVSQFNPAGSALVYSTYLGGSDDDSGNAIAIDAAGNAHVTGGTESRNFPRVNALQSSCRGCDEGLRDAFVTKIAPGGSNFVYSTFLGGNRDDVAFAIALDANANAYVTGTTSSGNFPRANPLQLELVGDADVFVAKLADEEVADLALVRIRAPRRVVLRGGAALTRRIGVDIQNRGQTAITIPDIDALTNLVSFAVASVGIACPDPVVQLHPGKPNQPLPVTVRPKKTLTVYFDVTFDCANDPLRNSDGDFSFTASVDLSTLPGGSADAHAADDNCPRSVMPPFEIDPNPDGTIRDKGCGGKKPDRTLGADVVTDVIVR